MAVQIGAPGNSARWHSLVQLIGLPLMLAFVWVLLAPIILWSMIRLPALLRVVTFMAGLVTAFVFARKDLAWFVGELREGLNYSKGADGEVRTARALESLPDDYVVIHDFHPLNKDGSPADWNVDHIVIGPNGVFVLDTKNYKSTRVPPASKSEFTKKNVKQAQRNASQLKSGLRTWSGGSLSDVFVVPVLVYVQPDAYVEKLKEEYVKVLPLKYLVGDIVRNHARRKLTASEALKISNVLFSQMAPHLQEAYRPELRRFGARVREIEASAS